MLLKRFIPLLILISFHKNTFAQTMPDYSTNWKKVAALEKKGLTASALKEVISIFNKAVSSDSDAQQIKAAMYQVKYRNLVEEDNNENNIFFIDTLIKKAKGVSKNILQSMQAELFWNYRDQNRYELYNRTQLSEEKSNDISTWTVEKLNKTITDLYKASLKTDAVLKKTSLVGFDAIIEKGKNTRNLRPTLYDFLLHRALAYFMSTENDVTKPSYKFILNNELAFAPVKTFINSDFTTKDSSSLYYIAIRLLQDILRFHIDDANPDALIDADLIRLAFVNEHGVFRNKESLYETALKNIESTYSSSPWAAQAIFLMAQMHYMRGQQYDPFTKKAPQFEIKTAKELCEDAIRRYPKSTGAINCSNLLANIKLPYLNIETEKVNVPNQPFKSLLKYKNVNTIYLRVIRLSRDQIKKIEMEDYDKRWQSMAGLKAEKSWSITLPDQQDYQQHSTEIKTDGLVAGTYIILASIHPDFRSTNNLLARQITFVSNIGYIINNKDEMYIANRDNGEPLSNAELQVWQQKYNPTSRTNEDVKNARYIADKNGYIKLKKQKDNYTNNYYQLIYKNDELFTFDNYYSYQFNGYEKPNAKRTFLFTDRSIYRPGQTVFFKGIVVSTDQVSRKSKILPGFSSTVILYDANDQKAGSLKLVSNEYGSFNGSFTLPANLLNGNFYIKDSVTESTTSINVEEYKRPRFSVEIKKPEGSYRVNDSITVTGNAKAYAGNNIDAAKVIYRVVRKVQYPIWWGWGMYKTIWPPAGSREEMEITNGETTTDSKGAFFITFKAIPDETVDKNAQPVFYYEVSTDITDLNGETRTGSTSIAVSYQALQLNIIAGSKMDADSLKNIQISSKNMNGIFEKANVRLTVQKIQSPNKVFRERYWQVPDTFVISKEEFAKDFPYDAYADEGQISKWPLTEKVIDLTDSTNERSTFNISHPKLDAGWYKVVATTKDKYGEEVRAEKYIRLSGYGQFTSEDPIVVDAKKNEALPGEKISYQIATGFEKIWLIHSLGKMENAGNTSYPAITRTNPFINEIDITESDRGGMNISYAFIKHNRVYSGNQSISIPWNNKDLKISYETFRDKILPGSDEKWKIKITGNQAEKVAAESLINMYDASLDQFKPHSWELLSVLWPVYNDAISWTNNSFAAVNSLERNSIKNNQVEVPQRSYDRLLSNGWSEGSYRYDQSMVVYAWNSNAVTLNATAGMGSMGLTADRMMDYKAGKSKVAIEGRQVQFAAPKVVEDEEVSSESTSILPGQPAVDQPLNNNIQVRKNFNETGFFFPALTTDANGNIEFSFTIPEALTSWKMMTLAHTKDLATGYSEKTVITQKPLMLQPNAARFLREGDRMEFAAKIVNLADSEITGTAQLELFDATTNKAVDGWFKNMFPVQYFTVAAGQSTAVKFPVEIPFNFNSALTWRLKAISKDGSFSDGEEAALPVLTNRMLVTESMPLNMRNEKIKSFKFEKLLNSGNSSSLTNHALTVEYSSNPAWYAVQALPYLMEYPYECAEQSFNRYYANTLASFVSNSTPKIKAVFEKWLSAPLFAGNGAGGKADTAALLSNLQKNEELKSALLQETPWVLDAQNESAQKKNIAVLFEMVRLAKEKEKTLSKLDEMQSNSGGFPWFKGGPDDRYITQYIITGIGHLRKLSALGNDDYNRLKPILEKAIPYLDAKLLEDYNELKKSKAILKNNHLSYTAIQYLYMRSFFPEYKINNATLAAYKYYYGQSQQYWLSNSKYMQAMIALALHRTNDSKTPQSIIKSLKENAIYKEEMGMYFKEFANGGYYWYQSPIESQAMLIEAFSDIDKDNTTINDLKAWLLKQKQTQNWRTTKATAEACYALLLNGSNWLSEEKDVSIILGNTTIKSTDQITEAGTGYFKQTIAGEKVQPGMANITVNVNSAQGQVSPSAGGGSSWGAVYWQYFEDLDKITASASPLKLVKKLFIEKNSDTGPVLQALNDGDELHVGDKVKVRIELKADRDMEYIHMKDMRAACMEPINVISEYKWQGDLGYYESTKDASTNFFFNWLPRGTYVFEYPLFVTQSGNFSNGITSIQCMYAPEFTSHSEGIRVNVAEK
ncbi:MAG: alpha-2-macroglobulin family protein [Ferruginibacter sp.]